MQGKVGTLADRPVYIVIASGGLFQKDAATQPDFLTHYLRAIFNTMGITSVHFFVVEGTVMGEEHLQTQFRKLQTSLETLLPSHIPL